MRVALYARTTAADQDPETVDTLLAGLATHAAQRGWDIVLQCADTGPWPEGKREGLRRLTEAVRTTPTTSETTVQAVLVRTLGHLARSLRHLTDLGRLQGDITLGYYLVRRRIVDIPGFDPGLARCVLHIILSHHGQLEHGSPVVPATREAVLVHMIDNLGGRLGSFDRLERQLPAGESWSGFDRALSGSAYFGQRAA
jgi:hypothetical protein